MKRIKYILGKFISTMFHLPPSFMSIKYINKWHPVSQFCKMVHLLNKVSADPQSLKRDSWERSYCRIFNHIGQHRVVLLSLRFPESLLLWRTTEWGHGRTWNRSLDVNVSPPLSILLQLWRSGKSVDQYALWGPKPNDRQLGKRYESNPGQAGSMRSNGMIRLGTGGNILCSIMVHALALTDSLRY